MTERGGTTTTIPSTTRLFFYSPLFPSKTTAISTCLFASSSKSKINTQHSCYLQRDLCLHIWVMLAQLLKAQVKPNAFSLTHILKHWNAQNMWAWFWPLLTTRLRSLKAKFASPVLTVSRVASSFSYQHHFNTKPVTSKRRVFVPAHHRVLEKSFIKWSVMIPPEWLVNFLIYFYIFW